ncbi:sugar diacid recognition domain-containing protein [Paraburkholderia phosphatilytica]|uniref:sugar diacid recognition domain-containing protein n=1 Tax=Paraburkholderia phosphatilytica TaxID=2282883 RepID=UPI000E46F717|nr:sugar diacid recognition domain-containing protein [Paraburkholderia phosphatilytica]
MEIDSRLAREIVERTASVMPFDVNVMDAGGSILASTDPARIGSLHAGAQLVLAGRRTVEIDASMAKGLPGARPGINLPLSVRGQICGVIGITGEPDDVRRFGELLRVTAEMMLERDLLTGELRQNARHREEFVLQLVNRTSATSEAELEAWAQRLGIDHRLHRVAIVCQLQDVDSSPELGLAAIERIQMQLAKERPAMLTAKTSFRELAMFDAIDAAAVQRDTVPNAARALLGTLDATLAKALAQPFTLALGIAMDGIDGFERSWQSALATLRIGSRRSRADHTFSYYDCSLPVLLSSLTPGWQARQLRLPLERLLAHERRSGLLLETLQAWYDNDGHPGATATALGIHRNTLDYRMRQISEATGLDLAVMDDRMLLYIALQIGDE